MFPSFLGPRAHPWRRVPAILLLAFTAGCKVDVLVAIDAESNGTGTVEVSATLDEEATARTPNLSGTLRVEDLRATGWTVTGPTSSGADTVLRATKAFDTPAEANKVLDEVTGPDGPIASLTLARQRKPLWWAWTVEGELDLEGGIERFGDEALRNQLEGSSFGVDATKAQEAFDVRVALDLPGSMEHEGAENVDGRAVWTGTFGESTALRATSRDWAVSRKAAAIVAVSAAAGVVVLWFLLRRTSRSSGSRSRRFDSTLR